MNHRLLKSLAIFKHGSVGEFTIKLGWNRNKVSKLLNGKYNPSVDEASEINEVLSLNTDEFLSVFFAQHITKR